MAIKIKPADLAIFPTSVLSPSSAGQVHDTGNTPVMYTVTNNGGRPSDRDPDLSGSWRPDLKEIVMGTYTFNTGRRSDKD